MEENRQKNSKRRLNSLILLVAFTAIMLIVSTYAWFSSQKNVTLTGLKGQVNVAEGLQVSLDASHFVNSINFDDFDQTDATSWTVKSSATTAYLDDGKTFQAPATGITNVVPSEYLPVSTTGTEGIDNETDGKIGKLMMYGGSYTNSEGLKDIGEATEVPASGYFAFDLYLQNSSATGITSDKLQLDANSTVIAGDPTKGVQNAVRVAFALYANSGDAMSINNEISRDQIIAGTSTGKKITDVAIWEPNANKHVSRIVEQTAIKFSEADKTKYTIGAALGDYNKIVDNAVLPTYALTAASDEANVIADVYDWATPATGLTLQQTTQTTDATRDESIDLKSVKTGNAPIQIIANQYQKLRVYVWIEGQDPDCVNYASLGKSLTLDLGLSKPENGGNAEEP